MSVDKLQYSIGNAASSTLSSSITNSDTSAPLTSDTNFNAKSGEGMSLMDEGQANEELAYATGKVGSSLTIPLANRGLEGGSAQAHSASATVKGVLTSGMWNNVIDALINLVSKTTGLLDTTKVVDLTTSQILTNKTLTTPTLTSPVLNTGVSGTAIDTDGTLAGNLDTKIASQKATKTYVDTQVAARLVDGWLADTDTWTYVATRQFKISGKDVTARFPKGTKLKLTQTTAKYFYVVASAFSTDTTITITGGADYSLANAAITSTYYSYEITPQGFPTYFSLTAPTWTTTGTAFTNQPINNNWKLSINGGVCHVQGFAQCHATSGGTGIFIATFTTGQIPVLTDAYGSGYNVTSPIGGYSIVAGGSDNVIRMAKYDATALATNSQYFGATINFII